MSWRRLPTIDVKFKPDIRLYPELGLPSDSRIDVQQKRRQAPEQVYEVQGLSKFCRQLLGSIWSILRHLIEDLQELQELLFSVLRHF